MNSIKTAAPATYAMVLASGQCVRSDGAGEQEMFSLTDMWRAAGSPKSKRPADWLRFAGKPFVEFVGDSLDVCSAHIVVRAGKGGTGGGGGSWAHWQIAMAYAKHLSHAFHAEVNAVYRAAKARPAATAMKPLAYTVLPALVVRDDLGSLDMLRQLCRGVADREHVSIAKVHGYLRKKYSVSSPYKIDLAHHFPFVRRELWDSVLGVRPIFGALLALTIGESKQTAMFAFGPPVLRKTFLEN